MRTTSRTLIVKAVGYKARKGKTPDGWQAPRVDDEIRKVMKSMTTVGARHIPRPEKTKDGDHCLFINSFKDLGPNQGVLISVCAYTKGHVPESMAPDMSSPEASIKTVELTSPDGKPSELVYTYRCLAFGQILIVESVQGAGGVNGLERLLRSLVKACSPSHHGLIELSDLASSELHELIARRGGVVKMTARLVQEHAGKGSTFGSMLSAVKNRVGGSSACLVSWEAGDDDTLDESQAIDLLQEYDDSSLSSVALHFKDGGSISELGSYRERKPVSIQLTPEGRPAVTEIEAELKGYLRELRDPDTAGPIKTDGMLKPVKKMSTMSNVPA